MSVRRRSIDTCRDVELRDGGRCFSGIWFGGRRYIYIYCVERCLFPTAPPDIEYSQDVPLRSLPSSTCSRKTSLVQPPQKNQISSPPGGVSVVRLCSRPSLLGRSGAKFTPRPAEALPACRPARRMGASLPSPVTSTVVERQKSETGRGEVSWIGK